MNKQEIRRAVIREWMAVPCDKRQAAEQTASFAVKAMHPQRRVSGDDELVAATDREAVTYGLPRRHPIVDMEMI